LLWRVFAATLVVLSAVTLQACKTGGSATGSCGSGEIGTAPNCHPAPPVPAPPGKSWHVVFSEEFKGSDFDHTRLTPCFDWNYGYCTSSFNDGKETYRPEQVRVSGGTAKLVAEPLVPPLPDDACHDGLCTYKSGLLSTARPNVEGSNYLFPFTYGYIEAKVKFPATPGLFSAFWLLPADPTTHYRSEIDIAEILGGHPSKVHMTYAYHDRNDSYAVSSPTSPNNGVCPTRDYSQDWVRLGVDWQPDHIAWYINGVECGKFTDPSAIESGPMQLILNLTVDNSWERNVGSVLENQSIVGELEVDYIRIYQLR
jgi:hypothetical protein